MTDESCNISSKTWMRVLDPITKAGYSDGVSDGQAVTYQSSFDTGYEQGIKFGFNLGMFDARSYNVQTSEESLKDPRKINCQICLNNTTDGNVGNLFNKQKENNDNLLEITNSECLEKKLW